MSSFTNTGSGAQIFPRLAALCLEPLAADFFYYPFYIPDVQLLLGLVRAHLLQ